MDTVLIYRVIKEPRGMDGPVLECLCGNPLTPTGLSLRRVNETRVELGCLNPFCGLRVIGYLDEVNGRARLHLPKVLIEYNEVMYGTEDLRTKMKQFREGVIRLLSAIRK
ncbi:MAG: hypothetical protein NZ920_03280 [Aigarchaeota archaeon]|nr:hypothetical protein [Aigarchaeota archaeon]MDW8092359.1 hypothetical protein [Nitrososphaerota archaeon]